MRIADLLKPGTVTIITASPEKAAAWAADLATEPDVAVVLCEDTPENCNINTCNRPPGPCSACVADYLKAQRPDGEVEQDDPWEAAP